MKGNNDKSVFIVLVNYNGMKHTIECVESIRKINYPNHKVIVVDNNSDEPVDYLQQKYPEVEVIRSNTNLGFAGGNNLGIKSALENKADYILLLNNDTTVEVDFLDILINRMELYGADVVCPRIVNYYNREIIMYAGGDISKFKGGVTIYDNIRKHDRRITFAHGCCMLLKSDVFKNVGLLPEEYFLYYEDTAYSAKLQQHGCVIYYIEDAVIYHKESVSTHKGSDDFQYYFIRNRLTFVKQYIQMPIKLVAYFYTSLFILKGIIQGGFDKYNCRQAIDDFVRCRLGKRMRVK